MPDTQRTIILDALQEIGVVNATTEASSEDVEFALGKLNRLYDAWNADDQAVYADLLQTFTLIPNQQPTTIGPSSANWSTPIRPQSIRNATLIISEIRYPINIHDAYWWATVTWPGEATSWPTDLYYNPTWPNGSLYFWTVPTSAYDVELLTLTRLGNVTLTDTFTLPPGYRDAITLTLAEQLVGPMQVEANPTLAFNAQRARARIFEANVPTPPMATTDIGVPRARSGWFNYKSGQVQRW